MGSQVSETTNRSYAKEQERPATRLWGRELWAAAAAVIAAAAITWVTKSYGVNSPDNPAPQTLLPQVTVSKPLVRELDSRLGFLGQFSAPPPRSAQLGVASDDLVELLAQPPTAAAGRKLATAIRRPLRLDHHTGRALAGSTGRSLSAAFNC